MKKTWSIRTLLGPLLITIVLMANVVITAMNYEMENTLVYCSLFLLFLLAAYSKIFNIGKHAGYGKLRSINSLETGSQWKILSKIVHPGKPNRYLLERIREDKSAHEEIVFMTEHKENGMTHYLLAQSGAGTKVVVEKQSDTNNHLFVQQKIKRPKPREKSIA